MTDKRRAWPARTATKNRERASSVDATRRCTGGTSTEADSPGGTSGAVLSNPEDLSRGRRIEETPDTAGFLKAREIKEEGAAAADVVIAGTEEDGLADREVGRRGFHTNAAQLTGRLGGSNTRKLATL
ncbi:hypothetical protein NDU88_008498 [Pleurodeles waltl]|uniref:Uncharacterized protein n=1 Tax=Pleurodeles waltl TaxID=8319 RepID=A0AAV7N6N5_PLEWA|nr:hypothetical protein NDU88_008498 [Pleurodeles waltl]